MEMLNLDKPWKNTFNEFMKYPKERADGVIFVNFDAYNDLRIYSYSYDQFIVHAHGTPEIVSFLNYYDISANEIKKEELMDYVLDFKYVTPEGSIFNTNSEGIELTFIQAFWVLLLIMWLVQNGTFFF